MVAIAFGPADSKKESVVCSRNGLSRSNCGIKLQIFWCLLSYLPVIVGLESDFLFTTARLNIPMTGPKLFANFRRLLTPSSLVISFLSINMFTPYDFHSSILYSWYPFLIPFREFRITIRAPRRTSQSASSNPNPPKPPNELQNVTFLYEE